MIRPLHDWMLVKLDPIVQQQGALFLPLGDVIRTATVMRVGPGRRDKSGVRQPVGVGVGERVAFRREHLEHQMGKQLLSLLQELGDDLGLLRAPDVLYVFEEGIRKRVVKMWQVFEKRTGMRPTSLHLTPREERLIEQLPVEELGDQLFEEMKRGARQALQQKFLGLTILWDAPQFKVCGSTGQQVTELDQ